MKLKRYIGLLLVSVLGVEAAELEEVQVTAQKREQNQQDVGIAVSVISAEQLREFEVVNSVDLVNHVTGMMAGTPVGEGNNPNFVLRGVSMNDYADSNEGPVAVYLDDVYNATLAGLTFQLFDLERVEVLRGPQGTLFGRNATGGLVHYISRRPTGDFSASVDMEVAENQQRNVEGVVNGPITDTLSGRLAYSSVRHEGTVKNSLGQDGNDADSQAARMQFLLTPSDRLSLLINLFGSDADSTGPRYSHRASYFDGQSNQFVGAQQNIYGTCPGCDAFGYRDPDGDPRTVEHDTPTLLRISNYGISSTLTWFGDIVTLTSVTNYMQVNKRYREEVDAGPLPLLSADYHLDAYQLSQEFRVQATTGALQWTTGIYYFQHDLLGAQRADASTFGILDMNADWDQRTESMALFGQVEFDISSSWRFIAGLRYTHEEKEFEQLLIDPVAPIFNVNFTQGQPGFTTLDDNYVSGNLALNWQPSDGQLYYASLSRGVKGGGYNAGFLFGLGNENIPFDEETLTSYEIGFKTEFFEGRYRINGAVFYYDYKDFQAFQLIGIGQSVFNTDAVNKGIDLEFSGRPTDQLELILGVSLLDATAHDIQRGATRKDRDMVFAPNLSADAVVRYSWPISLGSLILQYDVNYVGDHYFDIFNNPTMKEPGRAISNARFAYHSGVGNWQTAVWLKNITDKEYRNYSLDFTDLSYVADMVGPERSVGVSFSYAWQ